MRAALDEAGFSSVGIVASGGLNAERIRHFKRERVPVDAYGIGSSLVGNHGNFDFTADIVRTNAKPSAKAGRMERPNPRLAGAMARLFWVVDTQVDFIEPDRKLYVAGSEAIRPKPRQLRP